MHGAMLAEHPEDYPPKDDFRIDAVQLRDQITSPARTVLLVLLAASGLIFVIACSNVANLILARSVRREGELAIRAALGASAGALRRTLLAESLVLCGAGAVARRDHRPADGGRPGSLCVALLGARAGSHGGCEPACGSASAWRSSPRCSSRSCRGCPPPKRRTASACRTAASGSRPARTAVCACSRSRKSPRRSCCWRAPERCSRRCLRCSERSTGMNTRNVLALHVPVNFERPPEQTLPFYKEVIRRIGELPGVEQVAVGTLVPWREAGAWFDAQFTVEGYAKADGEDDPRARFRTVSPGFFAALGVPIIAGRDFNADDRSDSEKVVIVSESLAQRMFPNQDAVNRRFLWTDPVMKFIDVSTGPRRIVGIAADIDDENVVPGPAMVVYHPMDQEIGGGRLFVHAQTDPYALVPPITRIIRDLSAEQPVEQAATLEDVRAEVLAPNRLNALVFGGFAGVALTIAVVGVAGVLAFSVSARTREFGVRLAIGSTPRHLLTRILGEGAVIAGAGIAAGVVGGHRAGTSSSAASSRTCRFQARCRCSAPPRFWSRRRFSPR